MREVRLNSILDNDFYKITMQNAVVKLFTNEIVKYEFINRGKHEFPEGFADELRKSVNAMAELKLTKDEKKYLKATCPYLALPYLDFLEGFHYDPSEVKIEQTGNELKVSVEGLWYRTILWEVPLLALISELHYEMNHLERQTNEEVIEKTVEKAVHLTELGVPFAEFGTRRRHSYKVHRLVMDALIQDKKSTFTGTSNVHLAMLYNVKPIGTHAHEWLCFTRRNLVSKWPILSHWKIGWMFTAVIWALHFPTLTRRKFSSSSLIRNLRSCLTAFVTTAVTLWNLRTKRLRIIRNKASIHYLNTLFFQTD